MAPNTRAMTTLKRIVAAVYCSVWVLVGQTTFWSSALTSERKVKIFILNIITDLRSTNGTNLRRVKICGLAHNCTYRTVDGNFSIVTLRIFVNFVLRKSENF